LSVKIRVAAEEDLLCLLALMKEYYAYDRHDFDARRARQAMHRLLGNREFGTVFLIENGNEPVGYLVLALGYSLEYGGRDAFIDEFFILEQHRGKSLGRMALRHAERTARKYDVMAMHLEVTRHNSSVIDMYRRAGFVDHDRHLMTKRM
jgi:GNAT superfamily N-acetyltransferase